MKMTECHAAIFAWQCVLSGRPPVDYHLERGEITLHDAVVVNCKKDAATENQDAGA